MATIIYSTEHERIASLFTGVKAKHDADAALPSGSVLTLFLNEQGINLATDAANVAAANTAHTNFLIKERLSEELREKRDKLFDPAFAQHRDLVQYLKKLKRGKVHELGEWGVTVDGDDRITYPVGITNKIIVIKTFIAKHNSFAPSPSPLKPYLDEHPEIDLAQTLLNVDAAKTHHDNFEQASRDKEELRETRDTKMIDPIDHLLGIGQFLVGLFDTTPRKLGEWTFTIDDHQTKQVEKVYTISEGSQKLIREVVQGTVAENTGEIDILLYPGKTTDTTPITIPAGKKFIISRGFGTMVSKNPSLDQKASLKVVLNR